MGGPPWRLALAVLAVVVAVGAIWAVVMVNEKLRSQARSTSVPQASRSR
jgi:hypothetical protein